jgi:hypothetical protein
MLRPLRLHWLLVLGFAPLSVLVQCVGDNTVLMPDSSMMDTSTDKSAEAMAEAGPDVTDAANEPDQAAPCNVDAGMLVCGSMCIDPTTNASNCGACMHDCLGGQCVGSVCQPITLATITTGKGSMHRIATDGTYVVYGVWDTYANGGGVFSLSVNGTAQTPVAVASSSTNQQVKEVTVVGGHAYWFQDDLASTVTTWKGTAGTASSASQLSSISVGTAPAWSPNGIAVDSTETNLVFPDYNSGVPETIINCYTISSQTQAGAYTYGQNYPPGNIVTDDTNIYWAQAYGDVLKVDIQLQTSLKTIASGQATPGWVALDKTGGYLYWYAGGAALITRSSITTFAATGVATSAYVNGLAADSKYVYWTDSLANAVLYIAGSGGTSNKTLVGSLNNPGALTRDNKALYWLNPSDGTIRKVALPL